MCASATYRGPHPSTLPTAGDALTTPSLQPCTAQAAGWSRSCLAWWHVPSGTCLSQLVHGRAVFRLLEPQPVHLLRRGQNHKPLIHATLDTANLNTSKIVLKFATENPNCA